MNIPIALHALRGLRWQVFWYGLGLALYAGLMLGLFPAFEDTLGGVEYPAELLAFFGAAGDLADPRVFLQVEYFSFAPIIMAIYGIVAGTGLLAGDEGRRTLEPLLAQPVSRSAVFISRAVALLAGLLLIAGINLLGWAASVPFVDIDDLDLATLIGATFAAVPMVEAFSGIALLIAAISPSRGAAGGIAAAITIASYLVASFAQVVEPIAWAKWLSPYYYSDSHQLLTEGVVWWHQGVLVALGATSMALAWLAFRGREIDAGVWQPRAIARGWSDVAGRR